MGNQSIKNPEASQTAFALTLFRFFRGCLWMIRGEWVGGEETSVPKICHTYRTMMKLKTVIPYLKRIKQI